MPVIRSKNISSVSHLAGDEVGPEQEQSLETILGFQGYSERTLVDESLSKSLCMGDCVFEPGAVVPTHHHNTEELFYVFEGSGTAVVDDEEFQLTVGDVLVVPEGSPHSFRNESGRPWRMVFAYGSFSVATIFD